MSSQLQHRIPVKSENILSRSAYSLPPSISSSALPYASVSCSSEEEDDDDVADDVDDDVADEDDACAEEEEKEEEVRDPDGAAASISLTAHAMVVHGNASSSVSGYAADNIAEWGAPVRGNGGIRHLDHRLAMNDDNDDDNAADVADFIFVDDPGVRWAFEPPSVSISASPPRTLLSAAAVCPPPSWPLRA